MTRRRLLWLLAAVLAAPARLAGAIARDGERIRVYVAGKGYLWRETIVRNRSAWRQLLSAEQYRVLRERGTEEPYSSRFQVAQGSGLYRCAGCGLDLFRTADQYDSGTGWPSFSAPIAPGNVVLRRQDTLWRVRNEVICALCSGHLGHLFDDGPPPTGRHYCINGVALRFVPAPEAPQPMARNANAPRKPRGVE